MEQISSGSVCDRLSQLSSKYPWLISQCLEAKDHNTEDKFFCNIHGELPPYRCRIPQLLGTRIRGYFHGWVILSNHPHNIKWSLWNPVTSKTILLPHLILKDGEYDSIGQCCLSAPPNDPSSVILLTRTNKSTFVFCRVGSKTKKSRWIEMSYAKQLKRLTCDGKLVHSLTCCDGKVYALTTDADADYGNYGNFVIYVDIMVEDKEVAIKLMLFGTVPFPSFDRWGGDFVHYLKGSCTDLFYICINSDSEEETKKIPADVYLFKLDAACINWKEREYLKDWDIADFDDYDYEKGMDDHEKLMKSTEIWEEMDDLKGAIFFVDLARDHLVSYSSSISLELGGYIHIRDEMGETIYSCHVKDKTISLFPVPSPILPTSHVSMWESRLEDDHGETKKVEMRSNDPVLLRSSKDDGVELHEAHLLNIPFNILKMIIENCVGVEYLNFRATCKQCHIAAPLIKWSNETSLRRLQMYSVVSPWLMVVNQKRGIITFTDPMLGESYYMENFHVSILEDKLCCSRFGWLLFVYLQRLVFFNPFTNELRNLSEVQQSLQSLCFSAPPTSADCMVVGFTSWDQKAHILFVNREPTWHILNMGPHPRTTYFSTFYGRDLYTLSKKGELIVFNNLGKEDYSCKLVETKAPNTCSGYSTQNFLTNCDQHLLLVSVSKNGDHVTVFKWNDFKQEWEKVDGLGKHMIYICGTTCICLDAKMPQMENKIFFPQFHTKKKKIVFYSLDTCMYHTFDGNNIQEHLMDFLGTTLHSSPHAWIEPSWS